MFSGRRLRNRRDQETVPPENQTPEPSGSTSSHLEPNDLSQGSQWSRMFQSLQDDLFRILWAGVLFSMAAMQMTMVARAWLAYDITGTGLAIGLVAMARGVSPTASTNAFYRLG